MPGPPELPKNLIGSLLEKGSRQILLKTVRTVRSTEGSKVRIDRPGRSGGDAVIVDRSKVTVGKVWTESLDGWIGAGQCGSVRSGASNPIRLRPGATQCDPVQSGAWAYDGT